MAVYTDIMSALISPDTEVRDMPKIIPELRDKLLLAAPSAAFWPQVSKSETFLRKYYHLYDELIGAIRNKRI